MLTDREKEYLTFKAHGQKPSAKIAFGLVLLFLLIWALVNFYWAAEMATHLDLTLIDMIKMNKVPPPPILEKIEGDRRLITAFILSIRYFSDAALFLILFLPMAFFTIVGLLSAKRIKSTYANLIETLKRHEEW